MKLRRTFAIAATFAAVMAGRAHAQTAPNPFVDAHPHQSQSIARQADGTILVIPAVVSDYKVFVPGKVEPVLYPQTALIYEKRNPLPEIQTMGGTYAFFKGNYLATASADGFFTYKGKMNFEPNVIGGTFFTKKGSNEIVAIDSYGYFVETGITAPEIRWIGGNFFIGYDGVLTTIKSVGIAPGSNIGIVTRKDGYNFSDAIAVGGNFFLRADGSIVTIDSKNGFFSDPAYIPDSQPFFIGGNYFIGMDNMLYTVSSEGVLSKTIALKGYPMERGYSYMKFSDDSFVIVTGNGGAHLETVRVGAAGKAEYTTKIRERFDVKSIYVPRNSNKN